MSIILPFCIVQLVNTPPLHKLRVIMSGPFFFQTLDNAIHQINLYPVDNLIDFHHTFLLDSDLSSG